MLAEYLLAENFDNVSAIMTTYFLGAVKCDDATCASAVHNVEGKKFWKRSHVCV